MGSIKETMKVSVETLIKHPKLFVPFGIFNGLMVIWMYLYMQEFGKIFANPPFFPPFRLFILWGIFYLFLIIIFPFMESWEYSLLVSFFINKSSSIVENATLGLKKYVGFLGLLIVHYVLSMLSMIPLFPFFILIAVSIFLFDKHGLLIAFIFFIIFMLIMILLFLLIQILMGFIKPVYTYTGHFFDSLKKGYYIAHEHLNKALIIYLITLIAGILLSIPVIILYSFFIKNIITQKTMQYESSVLSFPVWFFVYAVIIGTVIQTFLPTAFTHLYLTFKRESLAPTPEQ